MKEEREKEEMGTDEKTNCVDKKLGRTFSQVQGQSSQPLSSPFDFFPLLDLLHFPSTFPLQKKESSNIYNGTLRYWEYRLAFCLE